jgi:hypothetical protein
MNLDLHSITAAWPFSPEEVSARLMRAADGRSFVQLRVELGVLQMSLDGRPDGGRYHGFATVLECVRHEARISDCVPDEHWTHLERELSQYNYRRIALASIAEAALSENDPAAAETALLRTVEDMDHCLAIATELDEHEPEDMESRVALIAPLTFNRARLLAKWYAASERYEDAIDELTAGAAGLEEILTNSGYDAEQLTIDPGLGYLRQLIAKLRRQHKVPRTLRERLDDALAAEDFATAATLRDELRRRSARQRPLLPAPEQRG